MKQVAKFVQAASPFEQALEDAGTQMQRIKVPEVLLEHTCPKCGKPARRETDRKNFTVFTFKPSASAEYAEFETPFP